MTRFFRVFLLFLFAVIIQAVYGHHPGVLGPINHLGPVQILVVVIAAIIDSINPTALGMMIFLLIHSRKKKMGLKLPVLYFSGLMAAYVAAGVGFWYIFYNTGLTMAVVFVQVVFALLLFLSGISELSGSWGSVSGPLKNRLKKSLLAKFISRPELLVVFGFLVGLVELLTTGAIYVSFLQSITFDVTAGIFVLTVFMLIYLAVFSIPMVLLMAKREAVTSIFQKNMTAKKILGVIFILVAIFIAATAIATISALASL